MNSKETLVSILQSAGYDLFSACQYAENAINEFKQSGQSAMTFNIVCNGFITRQFKIIKNAELQSCNEIKSLILD